MSNFLQAKKTTSCNCSVRKKAIYQDTYNEIFKNKVELLKASTFPQDYNFLNVKEDYLCGMSVPPVMTAQIATRIKKYIFDKIQEGKK